jgi:hypothetical protein
MAEVTQPPWSSDAALDDAFANWVPGQLDELLDELAVTVPDASDPLPLGVWSIADDDILPRRRRFRRR